jgi:hypothetical protein
VSFWRRVETKTLKKCSPLLFTITCNIKDRRLTFVKIHQSPSSEIYNRLSAEYRHNCQHYFAKPDYGDVSLCTALAPNSSDRSDDMYNTGRFILTSATRTEHCKDNTSCRKSIPTTSFVSYINPFHTQTSTTLRPSEMGQTMGCLLTQEIDVKWRCMDNNNNKKGGLESMH